MSWESSGHCSQLSAALISSRSSDGAKKIMYVEHTHTKKLAEISSNIQLISRRRVGNCGLLAKPQLALIGTGLLLGPGTQVRLQHKTWLRRFGTRGQRSSRNVQRSLNKLPRLCIFISSFDSSMWFIGADVVFLVRLEGRLTARGHTIVSEKAEVIVSKEDAIDLSWPSILAAAESRQTCQVASASPIGRFKSWRTCREKSSLSMREWPMLCVAAVLECESKSKEPGCYSFGLTYLSVCFICLSCFLNNHVIR